MALTTLLKQAAAELAGNHFAQDVRIGLCYTAVQLDDGRVGLAYTFRDCLEGGCTPFGKNEPLAGRPAAELLSLFDSDNWINRAIALATANALFNNANPDYIDGPALERIHFRIEDRVAMIGNFTPLLNEIKPQVKQLTVFERMARPEENILSIADADRLLPQCQVALITATAIINNSIDRLLALAENCREVVILGSSTPLLASVFTATPVTLLSGILVKEPSLILQIVSEGGGTPAFKRAVEKINLRVH